MSKYDLKLLNHCQHMHSHEYGEKNVRGKLTALSVSLISRYIYNNSA